MQCEEMRLDTRKNVPDRKDSSDLQSSPQQELILFKLAFTKKNLSALIVGCPFPGDKWLDLLAFRDPIHPLGRLRLHPTIIICGMVFQQSRERRKLIT